MLRKLLYKTVRKKMCKMSELKVCIPKDEDKIQKQIEALRRQLSKDANDKDKKIHTMALKSLEQALNEKYYGDNKMSPCINKQIKRLKIR